MANSAMSFQHFKEVFLSALYAFPRFLKNPVQGMRDLPEWEWPILVALQGALGLVCGIAAAILSGSLLLIFTSIIIAPVMAIAVNFILSGFFYYTFLFFFRSEASFRLIFTHLLFASIPVLVCNVVAPIIPLIGAVGVLASGLLLYVGFHENLRLDANKLKLLIGGLFAFYIISLAIQVVRFHQPDQNLKIRATPESLDILERELQQGSDSLED